MWLRFGYVAVLLILLGGCIGIRNPLPPDQSPVAVPGAQGTVSATFADMITETPVRYTVTFPNLGGQFVSEDFRVRGDHFTATPTLHFKPDEPLDVYVARFFNAPVPSFEPVPGSAAQRSIYKNDAYYAHPVTVAGRNGWLVVAFTRTPTPASYADWFRVLVEQAQVQPTP